MASDLTTERWKAAESHQSKPGTGTAGSGTAQPNTLRDLNACCGAWDELMTHVGKTREMITKGESRENKRCGRNLIIKNTIGPSYIVNSVCSHKTINAN